MSQEYRLKVALFIAIMSTAIAMSGSLAHVFAFPNKISLDRDAYFVVQGIYRGWSQFAYVLMVELLSILAVLALSWREKKVRRLAVGALFGLVAAQTIFWMFTYPTNVATDNWLHAPADWEALRTQWEYSHAAGAACQIGTTTCLVLAALTHKRSGDAR